MIRYNHKCSGGAAVAGIDHKFFRKKCKYDTD